MKRKLLVFIMLILISCTGCFFLTGCGGGGSADNDAAEAAEETEAADTQEAADAGEDFLIGTWFAKESSYQGETKDPYEVFGGTFYLYFEDDGDCTMAIDQKRALLKWERTGDGVTLTGDNTYQITFPDDSQTTLVITINDIDTLMEKFVEE